MIPVIAKIDGIYKTVNACTMISRHSWMYLDAAEEEIVSIFSSSTSFLYNKNGKSMVKYGISFISIHFGSDVCSSDFTFIKNTRLIFSYENHTRTA